MRFRILFYVAFSSLNCLIVTGCGAENQVISLPVKASADAGIPSAGESASTKSTPAQPAKATPSDKTKKPAFAALGGPKKTAAKPKFALKNNTPMSASAGANAPDRAAEVKRLIDTYQNMAIRYSDGLVRASTPEEKEALARYTPSARALRPIVTLLVHIVAADPKDTPALDALVFLCKFVGVPEIDTALAGGESDDESAPRVDPLALLLEHHSGNPKMVQAMRRLPRGDATDAFLQTLFDKTFNPEVRWSAGAQLISSLRRNNRSEDMEQIVITMSEDRYLEGVPVGRSNARTWAVNKLREIRTLGIGSVLPEVYGNKLEGGIGNITDYRGKVVVLDVWATWCGPCVRMIPHEVELAERLKDKPFAILSVSCDKDQETLEKFLEVKSMPWDHWWVAPDSEFKKALNISSFPTIYVLDGNGVIRHKNIKDEQLEKAIEALLAEGEESEVAEEN